MSEPDEQRRFRTPSRSRSREQSRHGSTDAERELQRARDLVHRKEMEVRRERERLLSRERSTRRPASSSEQHRVTTPRPEGGRGESRNEDPRSTSPHQNQRASRERDRDRSRRERSRSNVQEKHRSRSPTFSSREVSKLIELVKQQNTNTQKSIDYKNILPNFDPSVKNQRIDVWLKKVNECATVYNWDDKTTSYFATQKLQGLAKIWYESLESILFTWQEWQTKLLCAFPYEQNYGQRLEDMLRRKSRYNEPIENYYYEKLALINQCDIIGKRAVDCIIHGLSDRTMKSSALALRCLQPEQLLEFLMSNKDATTFSQPSHSKNKYTSETTSLSNGNNLRNLTKTNYTQGFHCFNCKAKDHAYSQCPKPLLRCNKCTRLGHKTENCAKNSVTVQSKPDDTQKAMCISTSNPNAKYNKEVFVEGHRYEAFVDFGSEVTLVKETVVTELGLSHDNSPTSMKGFGNDLVSSLGNVSLDLTIDGVKGCVLCKVVSNELLDKPILIGQSFTEQPHVVIFKNATKLQFLDIGAELPLTTACSDSEQLLRVRFAGHVQLYGAGTVKAIVEPKINGEVLLETKVIGKPNEQYLVCGGVYNVKNGLMNVLINPCSTSCSLQKNAVFSRGEKVQVVNRVMLVTPEINRSDAINVNKVDESNKSFDGSHIKMGESVSDDDRQRLVDLLNRFKRCFASNMKDLGCTNVTKMSIELSSQRPVVYRPYRLSHQERDKVRQMIGEMIDADIIRESKSEYASPIILVRKKDGTIRLCIDFRLLNSITIKERFPMPIIEDEIARLSGQAWFVTLDLMSGYYQVPIDEDSKRLTAFVTPDGQYEFNRMPFGLANAPAVFQRMMNSVLGSARFNKAMVYIDDLLVFGKTAAECLDRLEEVLGLLSQANLTLNLSKCSFLQNKIDYLGYEISASGIQPGKAKIQSVLNFPRPENVHGVRQFLGLVSYFRKFMKDFALIAHPLNKLLKKGIPWEWNNDHEVAFQALKEKLVKRPVLAIFNPAAELELHTDASRIGVGGILLQRSEGNDSLQPIAYYSRQTSPEEKNFHAYELETLAVISSLKKLRVYLLGKSFKIVSDCSALRSTFQKRDLIPRIARWWLLLQEFDCTVEYRPGTKMSHVDALSRNPGSHEKQLIDEQYPTVMAISEDDWLLTLQLGDSELNRIRDILCSNIDEKGLQYIRDNYIIRDNKLYRCLGEDKNEVRWVVPKGARWQVCKMCHDDMAHLGFEKTLERVKKNYWFAKMSRFVKKYVGACLECAYAKKTGSEREGLLHPIEKVAVPFHTLHIDHVGPFVKSKRGHTRILVVIDAFTKFVFIKSVRNTKTQNVINVLDVIFCTFRTPDRIISDRGSCFTSHAFKRFCLDKGIKHVLNAVASPQSNGQVERYNRTILDCLTAETVNQDERGWDTKLGKIQWGLNNTVQKTTGRSPTEVMFGTQMNSEVNPVFNEITTETRENSDVIAIRNEVKDRIDVNQCKQKEYYDKNRKPARTYSKGDLVKVAKSSFRNDGKSTKLMAVYEGPFKVVKVLGNDRYKLAPVPGFEGMKNRRKTVVSTRRMQPWIHVSALDVNNDDSEEDLPENDASDNDN